MKMLLASIYDKKACIYGKPFYPVTKADAIRAFGDIAVDSNHPVGKHPEDYDLFVLGVFDDNKGGVEMFQNMEHLANANDFVQGKVE